MLLAGEHLNVIVLLVDDNPGVRSLARVYAQEAGCGDVAEVSDGNAALAYAEENPVDVVVMDFHMPGLDGLRATEAILAVRPEAQVIAWTSVLDPAIEAGFLRAGAREHVPKVETGRLRELLSESCGGRDAAAA